MLGYDKLTDNELWKLIKKHDQKAFRALFDMYWSKVFTTAFRYLKDKDTCTEIVNDLFLNIWNKREQLEIESLQAYLTSSARYHVYKKLKALKTSPLELVENYDLLIDKPENGNPIDDKIKYQELESRIDTYLTNLPKRCREIFIMSRKENLSNDEIAEKLNISKRTVENQLTHALKHLRNCLKDLSIILVLLRIMDNY
ncbi:RNA polymerase sigma factor [Pedobacter puniceum]|jgi:RNA polymerase sigma-70 factor (ECF subfamily)|uniref:RNA polymerase sigma-70 factor n=1 Tax=Pedobacter puniceum TaxID=2666136 RepID=A0A7K0FLJ4_9SPHI|nr:RNA polymerase sigma-70 factor [Pedobacter puniceum]MRX46265.1 RNA polymerase sigma-70 factor [Pedobacter puniceum]